MTEEKKDKQVLEHYAFDVLLNEINILKQQVQQIDIALSEVVSFLNARFMRADLDKPQEQVEEQEQPMVFHQPIEEPKDEKKSILQRLRKV